MRKQVLFSVLIFLIVISILGFALSPTGFAISQTQIDQNYLEDLRLKAEVECLQNSQCSEGFECVANECVDKKEIDVCQNMGLSLSARRLEIGDSINSVVGVIVEGDLPYLLPHGKIVKIENDEAVIYLYEQMIWIGDNKVKEKDGDFILDTEEFVYKYSLVFSKNVDFSSKNIQGQVLRILGEEYIIGSGSDNSAIELISNDKTIKLEDGKKVKTGFLKSAEETLVNIIKNEKGIAKFDIIFSLEEENKNIKTAENYINPFFDSIKFDFNSVNEGFVDAHVGGNC